MELTRHAFVDLPEWIAHEPELRERYIDDEAKIALAIELSRLNVHHRTGGPFGAAVFDDQTGELLGLGVNRVVPLHNSTAHAEIIAIMLAQQKLRVHRLTESGRRTVLAASGQPCAMCYGSLFWSGIDRLLVAATKEDIEQIAGFDEGPLPRQWRKALSERGIRVQEKLLRPEAVEVLKSYAASGQRY